MLGDTNVGKTSLVLRFAEGYYRESSRQPTVGAFFITKRVQTSSGITCKVQIWDTAGQSQFRKMLPMYYKTAAAAIVCFDVTNSESWYAAKEWVDELKGASEMGDIVLAIVATKSDLLYTDMNDQQGGEDMTPVHDHPDSNAQQSQTPRAPRKMTLSPLHESILNDSKDLASSLDAIFIETSSRNDENVAHLFQKVAEKVLLVKERNADSSSGMQGNIPVVSGASVDGLGRVVKTVPYSGMNGGNSSPLVSRKSTNGNGNGMGLSSSNVHHPDDSRHNRTDSHLNEHENIIIEDVEQIPGDQGNAGLCLGAHGLFRCSSEKDVCIIS
jgi:small GTP-binding protein